MAEHSKVKISFPFLILEGLGSALFGLGMAKMVADIDVLPVSLQFDETGWTMIILGVLLMLPFLFHFLSQIRSQVEDAKRVK